MSPPVALRRLELASEPAPGSTSSLELEAVAGSFDEARLLVQVQTLLTELSVGPTFEKTGAMCQEHLATGGKRMRARLALEACRALEVPWPEAIPWAAAVEGLHQATLVHDDLQDRDAARRGSPTVWARHGAAQAINVGDLLLMVPFLAVARLPADARRTAALSAALAERAVATVRGQAQEIDQWQSRSVGWEAYERAAVGKTGHLLVLPLEGALLLAGREARAAARVADALLTLGFLFQLQDDHRDLYGNKGRGERGGDLRRDRANAVVVSHLDLKPSDRDRVFEALRRGVGDHEVELWLERFRRSGAVDRVLARARDLAHEVESSPAWDEEPALRPIAQRALAWMNRRLTQESQES